MSRYSVSTAGEQGRKVFFSEQKKQKTRMSWWSDPDSHPEEAFGFAGQGGLFSPNAAMMRNRT
jgi:hypothetical protein